MDKKTPKELQQENIDTFMEIGPRLSRRYNTFIVARDRVNKYVLIGGLGCMGVGRMWFPEDGREDYPGFDEAPEQSYANEVLDNALREAEMLQKRTVQ